MFKLTSDHGNISIEISGDGDTVFADILLGMRTTFERLKQSEAGKELVEGMIPVFAADGPVFNDEAMEKMTKAVEERKKSADEARDGLLKALEELKEALHEALEDSEDDSE